MSGEEEHKCNEVGRNKNSVNDESHVARLGLHKRPNCAFMSSLRLNNSNNSNDHKRETCISEIIHSDIAASLYHVSKSLLGGIFRAPKPCGSVHCQALLVCPVHIPQTWQDATILPEICRKGTMRKIYLVNLHALLHPIKTVNIHSINFGLS